METTNSVFNTSLYDAISVESVPYWSRVVVAARVATSSPEWHEVFYKQNSVRIFLTSKQFLLQAHYLTYVGPIAWANAGPLTLRTLLDQVKRRVMREG
jgi:hypothetical protein